MLKRLFITTDSRVGIAYFQFKGWVSIKFKKDEDYLYRHKLLRLYDYTTKKYKWQRVLIRLMITPDKYRILTGEVIRVIEPVGSQSQQN